MRDKDTASSSLACCAAVIPEDGPLGFILEEFDAAGVPREQLETLRGCVIRGLKSASGDSGRSAESIVFEPFRKVYLNGSLPKEIRLLAASAGIASNDPFFGESYQHYADQFAMTRACVHNHSRNTQKALGVKARRDKSEAARAGSAALASGPRCSRPVRVRVPENYRKVADRMLANI